MGLVSKGRRQQQIKLIVKYSHQREETKKFGMTKKKYCKECGIETAGIFKDGKLRCPKCKQIL